MNPKVVAFPDHHYWSPHDALLHNSPATARLVGSLKKSDSELDFGPWSPGGGFTEILIAERAVGGACSERRRGGSAAAITSGHPELL